MRHIEIPSIEILAPNFARVYVDGWTLAFSYQDLIGFYIPRIGKWLASSNPASNTTGKHLNTFSEKKDRINRNAFLAIYKDAKGGILANMLGKDDPASEDMINQRIAEIIENHK